MTDQLIIFDTTLRDGEQSPGASMTARREAAHRRGSSSELRVDVIEAGFRGLVQWRLRGGARRIARGRSRNPPCCSLARANDRDIARAADALKPAPRSRIHTFIATSALHMEKKLRMTPEQVLEQAQPAVRFARNLVDDVEFSPEDGYRAPTWTSSCRRAGSRDRRGRHAPSTCRTRSATPSPSCMREFFAEPARAGAELPTRSIWSVHCHNDLGHGRGQLAGRREDRRRASGRMHHQRPGRACRQLPRSKRS
jgi:2-isopropylmalate synthase